MKNVMLDLETLSSCSGAAILSIGAVAFDDETLTGEQFYVNVDLQSCIDAGLKVSGDTFYWWMSQGVEAQKVLSMDRVPLISALDKFKVWLGALRPTGEDVIVWSHGLSFDVPILANAYELCTIWRKPPWGYRNVRDTRTLFDLIGGAPEVPFVGTKHNALDDAMHQAILVLEAKRFLKKPESKVFTAETGNLSLEEITRMIDRKITEAVHICHRS